MKGFKVQFTECPFSHIGYRAQMRDMLNDFEYKYNGTKQGIINSFLQMLPMLQEKATENYTPIASCETCKEPCNGKTCNACKIMEVLNEV